MVQSFLQDAKRFVLRFQSILADAPLQIYYSAIVFAPQTSLIRQTFEQQVLHEVRMLSMKEADWDACHSTLEGHSDSVTAVAFSPDGQVLHTNAGDISLLLSPIVLSHPWQQTQSSHIFLQDQWILRNQQRFLWLPAEYRYCCLAVRNDIVCLGLRSGRIVQLRIY